MIFQQTGAVVSSFRSNKPQCTRWGGWLSFIPSRLNGNNLSTDHSRSNLCLRYNICPVYIPYHCDGCGDKMIVKHVQSYKKGGIIHIRYDDVVNKCCHLCRCALSLVRQNMNLKCLSVSHRVRVEVEAVNDNAVPHLKLIRSHCSNNSRKSRSSSRSSICSKIGNLLT